MKIAYLVHDLSDAAVERRVTLFKWGGGEPILLGFHREPSAPAQVSGVAAFPISRTEPGKLVRRIGSVLKACLNRKTLFAPIHDADVMVARNLEMLLLAWWLRRLYPKPVPLVYECLDIHSKMLGNGPASKALRAIERFLIASVHSIIVSSPAFRDRYFRDIQRVPTRVDLIENKGLDSGEEPRKALQPLASPPWIIGWFGVIRCRKSLAILKDLVTRIPNLHVLIAGKPAYDQLGDFEAGLADYPQIRFIGPYKQPDLPTLYAQVHLTWAIDYFEEGQNSSWLLPNRLYEGGICGSLPIALADVETGRWLAQRNAGLIISDPETDLPEFFSSLDTEHYQILRGRTLAIPASDLILTRSDAGRIVAELTT